MRSARAPVLVLSATLLLAVGAAGQVPSPTGNLYGTALDEQGKSLPGVTVTLTGPGATQAASTDKSGEFHFLGLSPGSYVLYLQLAGFAPVQRQITVALGRNSVVALTMAVAAEQESVVVHAEGPAIDSRKVETGEAFSRKELDTIPTTRDPWSILRQVPGVLVANMNVNGSASGVQSIFVGKGSHSDQNTYNLDGVAITDMAATGSTPIYFDFDSFEDIDIVTGGSDPSLSTPGVTLNLVTRRGTNELRGSGRGLYFFPSSVGSEDQATSQGNWEYGLEAGGPLVKDRLWLWAAGAGNNIPGATVLLPDGQPFQASNDLSQWNAKLNGQIVPSNSLTLFYLHFDKVFDGRGAGPDRSIESAWNQTTPTSAYRAEDSEVLSQQLFASAYFSYLTGDFTLTPVGGLDRQAEFDADYVWQNSYFFYHSRRPQHQAGLTASAFFETGNLSHELKFGFGYKHTRSDSLTVWPGDMLVADEVSSLAWVTRAANAKYEMNYYDSYLGDTIQTGNLTINLGLRFDYQQGKNLPSVVPPNPAFPEQLPSVQYAGDSGYPITWRTVEPRVGVTYALGPGKQTLLKASYAKFANQLGQEIWYLNAFPGPAYLYYDWVDANGDHRVEPSEVDLNALERWLAVNPDDPASTVSVNQIAPHLKPPETDEFIVGVERQIFTNLSASIAYTHRSTRNLEFPFYPAGAQPIPGVTSSDYQYAGNATGTAASNGFNLTFSEPLYALKTCPAPCAGVVIENRPDYTMTYNGVELQVVKRLSNGWSLRAGFAYNDWTQTVGPGAIVNPNNLRTGTNASGPVVEVAGMAGNTGAGSFINSKWQFNVGGTALLPLGITAAANFFGRQGFPTVYYVNALINDALGGSDRIPLQIGDVAAYRNPDVYELDLHLERPFRIGSRVIVTPSLDCFNVVNSHTVLQRVGLTGNYDATGNTPEFTQSGRFNAPVEQLSNRTFRLGVRISF
ncbi:MAG TPA: TonB-dependent receptor [Thermoanaerobaculia bacterium]|nr:TonB-dependent receptor [Thermoanaerobaculia bacterium]